MHPPFFARTSTHRPPPAVAARAGQPPLQLSWVLDTSSNKLMITTTGSTKQIIDLDQLIVWVWMCFFSDLWCKSIWMCWYYLYIGLSNIFIWDYSIWVFYLLIFKSEKTWINRLTFDGLNPPKPCEDPTKLLQKQNKFQGCIVEHPFSINISSSQQKNANWPTTCEFLTPTIANHNCL